MENRLSGCQRLRSEGERELDVAIKGQQEGWGMFCILTPSVCPDYDIVL